MKKLKKMIIVFCILLLVGIICVGLIVTHNKREREKLGEKGYTQYDLSERDLFQLDFYADITIPEYQQIGRLRFFEKNKYNRDKDKFVLVKGDRTDAFVDKLNFALYGEGRNEVELLSVAEKYGLSKDNQMTAEWILSNPRAFVEMRYADRYSVFDSCLTPAEAFEELD
ncbi:MAG: hypothetical protein Q4D54_03405 [Eubacteriales bacterium]|nr:hypothetical protein [Lachnospiraceae bacterium]MDO5126778.1 hypothetical protein [Eubacteriales bacterium]